MDSLFYHNILSNINEGIYFVDKERRITFWNKGAERITGFSQREVLNKFCYDNILNHVDSDGNQLCFGGCPLHKTIRDAVDRDALIYLNHKAGHRVPVHISTSQITYKGEIIGAVESFTDESAYVTILDDNEKLKELALYDQLTNLPNRRYMNAFLESRINDFNQLGIPFGIAMFDIDFFKHINDQYGHDVGDQLLVLIAKTCQSALRNNDLFCRFGGEEFIAIYPGIDQEGLTKICNKLRVLVNHSGLRTEASEFNVTISVGATLMSLEDSKDILIRRADELLYQSKTNGRNLVTVG